LGPDIPGDERATFSLIFRRCKLPGVAHRFDLSSLVYSIYLKGTTLTATETREATMKAPKNKGRQQQADGEKRAD